MKLWNIGLRVICDDIATHDRNVSGSCFIGRVADITTTGGDELSVAVRENGFIHADPNYPGTAY